MLHPNIACEGEDQQRFVPIYLQNVFSLYTRESQFGASLQNFILCSQKHECKAISKVRQGGVVL